MAEHVIMDANGIRRTLVRLAHEIAERDERNVAIGNAAKAKGYDVMTFAFGAMLLFSVLMEADLALTLVMVAVYLFIQFYSLWWRFKLEKEM